MKDEFPQFFYLRGAFPAANEVGLRAQMRESYVTYDSHVCRRKQGRFVGVNEVDFPPQASCAAGAHFSHSERHFEANFPTPAQNLHAGIVLGVAACGAQPKRIHGLCLMFPWLVRLKSVTLFAICSFSFSTPKSIFLSCFMRGRNKKVNAFALGV